MALRREELGGLERLNATSVLLQRARRIEPLGGMWEAADVQWWWRKPRVTDELALPVWFDDAGPVAAVGLTAEVDTWQADIFVVPSAIDEAEVWDAMLEASERYDGKPLQMLVSEHQSTVLDLALRSGFTTRDDETGTTWMDAERRPSLEHVDGFTIVDRATRSHRPHPMVARNGEQVAQRLAQCSLYDPTLDLAVEAANGDVAGYALFWFDPVTLVGLLEPMRVHEEYQRRGIARMLITNGLDRLARKGAQFMKVGFGSRAGHDLYVGAGFVQKSVDRVLTRADLSVHR